MVVVASITSGLRRSSNHLYFAGAPAPTPLSFDPTPHRDVVVFARAPEQGRVKTRLAAGVGDAAALAIYRELGERTFAAASQVSNARVIVQHTPPDGGPAVAAWFRGAVGRSPILRPQCDGSLGERMGSAIATSLAEGAAAVVVIGTDCPDLDASMIERAFTLLDTCDVVLGPAVDGGYYLIAARAVHPALFEDIPWSSRDTLRCTCEAAGRAGLRVGLLEELSDVDVVDDWVRWTSRR